MIRAWPAAAVAAAEQPLLAAGADLMGPASAALASACLRLLRSRRGRASGARVVLLVGTGNNGGDALHAGAVLSRRGVAVTAVLAGDRVHEAGLQALRRAGGRLRRLDGVEAVARALALVAGADLVVDGVLGIGARGAVRGPMAEVLGRAAPCGVVVACDLPSGVDPDTGVPAGAVLPADLTVSFGAATPGLLLPPGDVLAGLVEVVDLGLALDPGEVAVTRWEATDAAAAWPVPWRRADKYARGVLGVVAGSPAYAGAGVLAVAAAAAAGAGMIRYAGDREVGRAVVRAHPEVVVDPLPGTGRVQAWLVGPGTAPDQDPAAARHVTAVLDRLRQDPALTAVADAGAVVPVGRACAAGEVAAAARVLLTPHAGELSALLAALGAPASRTDVEADPAGHATRAAAGTGATVLLKGATTIVTGPDGPVVTTSSGTPWLATAGSGDVLSGVAGTLLSAGLPPGVAGPVAALVHGLAGRRAAGGDGSAQRPGGPVSASQVAEEVPAVVRSLHPAPRTRTGPGTGPSNGPRNGPRDGTTPR